MSPLNWWKCKLDRWCILPMARRRPSGAIGRRSHRKTSNSTARWPLSSSTRYLWTNKYSCHSPPRSSGFVRGHRDRIPKHMRCRLWHANVLQNQLKHRLERKCRRLASTLPSAEEAMPRHVGWARSSEPNLPRHWLK